MTQKKPTQSPNLAAGDSSVALEDFCRTLSIDSTRVELISAFLAIETRAGRTSAPRDVLQERFHTFTHAPADAGAIRGTS